MRIEIEPPRQSWGDDFAKLKQAILRAVPAGAYYDIKDPVFDIIMEGANEWAKLIGWSEPPGD